MDKLNPVKDDLGLKIKWCGPTAVASITGKPLSKVYEAFRSVIKGAQSNEAIKGTTPWQVSQAFKFLGFKMVERDYFDLKPLPDHKFVKDPFGRYSYHDPTSRPTLAQYTRKKRAKFQRHAMLVEVTGHWTTVFGRRGMDNHTPGYTPVPLSKLSFRRSRVIKTWNVLPIDETFQSDPVLAPPPKPPKSPFIKKAKVQAAAVGRTAAKIDYSEIVDMLDKKIAEAEKGR